jgi:D-glycero-beta-D-manno-heptose-7-phosphate kinase
VDSARLKNIFDDFSNKHLLLIGDIMLDAYIWGKVDRMSPEAPVPVLDVQKREERLGGLANVAINLKELGAKVTVCSIIGDDHAGKKIVQLFEENGLDNGSIILSKERVTTVKTRVISNDKHVIRVDEEQTDNLNANLESQILTVVNTLLQSKKIDCIVFEDYNKGVLTEKVISNIITTAKSKNIPTSVDPKKKNFFAYKGVTLFKPNLKELTEGLELKEVPREKELMHTADEALRKKLGHEISLITLSELGVFISKESQRMHFPAAKRKIADVSGAGDTVIAVASLCLACGCNLEEIAVLSNLAGGLVCEFVGVVPISKEQLYNEAQKVLS